MAIRFDRDKRKDTHAHRMKRNHRIAARGSKDVLRFAPNFSVYVLPPNVVCLYSEDRKFFLHGELYCALASAIGQRGKNLREILRDLEHKFPPDKVHEAIRRLIERRFAATRELSLPESAAAYWASLGLVPEIAATELKKYRVGIRALEVAGAAELEEALNNLGIRVSKRSADL